MWTRESNRTETFYWKLMASDWQTLNVYVVLEMVVSAVPVTSVVSCVSVLCVASGMVVVCVGLPVSVVSVAAGVVVLMAREVRAMAVVFPCSTVTASLVPMLLRRTSYGAHGSTLSKTTTTITPSLVALPVGEAIVVGFCTRSS